MSLTCTHHLPELSYRAVSHGMPKTELRTLFLGFCPKPHPPASCWRTRSPPGVSMPSTHTYHLPSLPHAAVSHGTPEIELQTLGFGFLAYTPPRLRVGERAAPLASPCHPPAPAISHHRPTPPFHMACPKSSYKHSLSGF